MIDGIRHSKPGTHKIKTPNKIMSWLIWVKLPNKEKPFSVVCLFFCQLPERQKMTNFGQHWSKIAYFWRNRQLLTMHVICFLHNGPMHSSEIGLVTRIL